MKSIGECLFMGSDETGEILARDQESVWYAEQNKDLEKKERKRPTLMKS